MSALRLLCLGTGDAFSRLRYSSALALESAGARLLVDCPHPIRKILHEASTSAGLDLDVGSFDGVVLTHLHADHASGLEDFGYFSRIALGRRAVLLTHAEAARNLDAALGHLLAPPDAAAAAGPRLADLFELRLLADDAPTQFGPFAIECRPTSHSLPTRALRIRAGGRILGLSADTAFDPGLIAWLAAEADLVVHETGHGPHTPYAKLAELPEPLRAKMRLIHYPDDFDAAASVIEPLVQGRSYEV
ncbi:MAG TPA: MBL fold metallo-hydrolase [Isosphaeraceae bacterium]|jgi:ribonuclease BN (tRNA processing enzyme)